MKIPNDPLLIKREILNLVDAMIVDHKMVSISAANAKQSAEYNNIDPWCDPDYLYDLGQAEELERSIMRLVNTFDIDVEKRTYIFDFKIGKLEPLRCECFRLKERKNHAKDE